ncbi:hypothetical protein J1G44_08950 [Cellulomonas sp. zg-ZUI199]|uniref:RNA-binding protein n=1 Tax=Cellulomonas wangleii TaxID=2816956 RepID=A0ABX8D556_9CELL|nr:hypothetical protein [Cellulomonas wangleii]MBO0924610.1 hypothetical protein [Cellulomonas wangleii]QVI62587.1 hypothetical protein KG103_01130 [Cellulomonas wangleii]
MAMNDDAPPPGDDLLGLATAQLRTHTDAGWVAVAPRLLASALAAVRPTQPVRGRHPRGAYTVTAGALRTSVRALLEPDRRLRVRRVVFRTGADDALEEALVEVSAAYLQPLAPLAADVRRAVLHHLRDVLGDPDLPGAVVTVDVLVTDVHRT